MTRGWAVISGACGLGAVGAPGAMWAYIVFTQWHAPQTFHDQGGMVISFVLFPLGLIGAMALGGAALAAGAMALSAPDARPADRALAGGGIALSAVGMLLAWGMCIGPQMLAEWLR